MRSKLMILMLTVSAALTMSAAEAIAEGPVEVDLGVDLYSRYIWRGTDLGNNPSIQPTMAVTGYGFEAGAWGAYSFSTDSSGSDEIDYWVGYSWSASNGAGIGLIVTDYYFPNAGIEFSDSEAHIIELGASVTGPESFPVTLSGYVNVHNDDGHNTYFQLDYPATAGDVDLGFFVGLAGGSSENPDYYATENPNVINMGVSATREIEVTNSFSMPLTASSIYNPRTEVFYLVVGVGF